MSRRSRAPIETSRLLAIIGVAALGVAVVVMAMFALAPRTPAASDSTYTPRPLPAETVAPVAPVALFLGDSYTHGTGASDDAHRWSTVVATTEGWTEVNEALGGTGYLTTSGMNGCGRDVCPNYTDNLLSLDTAADVVVIAGGQNDFGAWADDSQAVTDAIWATYAAAKTKYPTARIIAVGPSIIGTVSQNVIYFDAQVQAAAASIGAEYISLINPDVLDSSMDVGDGGHVNDVGHQAIASTFLAAVPAV